MKLYIALLAAISMVLASCAAEPETRAPEAIATTGAPASSTTTTTTLATTTTVTLPPPATTTTSLPAEPTTAADFEALYIELDGLRSEARRTADLDLMATAVTTASASYERLESEIEAGHTSNYAETLGGYTIDNVDLYDQPTDARVQMIVQDTFLGEVVITDGSGAEVSRESREVATQIFLVTMVDTADGWRIASDQNITRPGGDGTLAELALGPEADDLRAADENYSFQDLEFETTFWKPTEDQLCLQVRILDPALGRAARCVDPAGEAGTLDLYVLPFEDDEGTLYTTYFLVTPGGELRWVEWDLADGKTATDLGRIVSIDFDLTAAWGVFEGEPVGFRMEDEDFTLIFEAEL